MRPINIEQRLKQHPQINDAVIIVRQFHRSDRSLTIAFCKVDHNLEAQSLREYAMKVLPPDLVPDVFIPVDRFPFTEEGTIDREKLTQSFTKEGHPPSSMSAAPVINETERSLLDHFCELLDVGARSISLDDDFFELGGSSIHCVELFTWIDEHFGIDLPLSTITSAPTVRLLAAMVDRSMKGGRLGSLGVQALPEQWEWMLCILWSDILRVDNVEPQDNFFALGGDATDGQRMADQLKAIYGIDVTLADLKRAPTVSQLATLTRGHSTRSCLLPLNALGSKTPFFCIAGLGGLALAFLHVSRELGTDQPFYGLQAHGLDRRGLPDYTIKHVVTRYVTAMRSVQPHGPYLIGGHSFGGLLALEVAYRLSEQHEDVALLTVFDTILPERLTGQATPASTADIDQSSRARWPNRQLLTTLSKILRVPAAGLIRQRGDAQTEVFRLIGKVQVRFAKPLRTWSGNTALFIAEGNPDEEAILASWRNLLTGTWTRVSAPGDHLSMMQRPHATLLAQNLRGLFTAALDSYGSNSSSQ